MITVLTPTYNRAYTLTRLYDSLVAQEDKNFEWVVVDDGSTDSTLSLIKSFQNEKKITIRYFFQENKGKPQALNLGVYQAKGNYIFIVDSDDCITQDCISVLIEKINLHQNQNLNFSGLCFRRGHLDGSILGKKFSENNDLYIFCNATYLKNNLNVDLAYCFKKNYLQQCKFPFFEGEKFVPELFIWNKLTDIANVYMYMNKCIYLGEYLSDGLSANFKSQLKRNPRGFLLYYKDQFFREKHLINKLKMLIRLIQCTIYKAKKEL